MTFDEWKEKHAEELSLFGKDSMLYKRIIGWCENAYFTGCLEMQDREADRHGESKPDFSTVSDVFTQLNNSLFPGRAVEPDPCACGNGWTGGCTCGQEVENPHAEPLEMGNKKNAC